MSGWVFALSITIIAFSVGYVGGLFAHKSTGNEEIKKLLVSIDNDINTLSNKYENK